MERKRTQSGVIFDDDEEEEGKDWKSSTWSRKKARFTEISEGEEEESEEKEEEKEENKDRRSSPRKIKRPIYTDIFNDYHEYDEYEDDDEDEEEQEEDHDNNKNWDKDEEDNEQPGPSTKNTHNQGTWFLDVTCGAKTGILDVKKLERSEECIKSGGNWFSPPAFEHFGGKSSAKKWKSSIFHEDKPLQFLFEQGALTTKGYKRRRRKTTKKMKLQSSNQTSSESSSEEREIHAAEETEEDDVEDEDWLPSSEELLLETEKVKGGVENGEEILDSGDEKSKDEEDGKEKGEVEDEDMTAVADNDSSGFEEMEAKSISSIPEKSALLKKVEVVITRLPKTAFTSIIKGAEEEKEKEFPQSNERKDDGQREITTENGNTLTPVHPPATSSQDKTKTEDIASTSNHAANLSPSRVRFSAIDMKAGDCGDKDKERKRREMGPEIQTQWPEGFGENSNNEHVSMSGSEASDHPVAATSLTQRCVKEEGGESLNVMLECKYENTDATSVNNDAAQLQVKLDTSVETTQTTDVTQTWVMLEVPSSQPSTSCDLDAMDLDQLRREKIKMQIKVLRLQEQYYTRKVTELQN